MKKGLLLLPFALLAMTSCGAELETSPLKTFTDLQNNQVLYLGNGQMFRNYYTSETNPYTVNFVANQSYSLYRSLYNDATGSGVLYEGYYYFWQITDTNSTNVIGNRTTVVEYYYSFLRYGENENVAVRTRIKNKVSYDFKSGFYSFNRTFTVSLNSYFSSESDLKTKCPTLYYVINRSTTSKKYIAVTNLTTYNTTINTYNTFYYIETVSD